MRRPASVRGYVWPIVLALAVAGCGATRSSPDNPLGAGELTPTMMASMGFFGGGDEEHLEESFDDMARDLTRFLMRLSKGEAPTK